MLVGGSTYCELRLKRGSYNVAISGFKHRTIYSRPLCAIAIKAWPRARRSHHEAKTCPAMKRQVVRWKKLQNLRQSKRGRKPTRVDVFEPGRTSSIQGRHAE
jgi:hypothetical protein